ncbi:MAG: DUF362 domain-containing protein [Candidatus Methanoperedens sp.]|nr:DUF362 domain-containing protein [Candidatus Methanoperedens sp.]MCE8427185.1 DUF362 domain-containing protein [Candidatus Methanoperedens sp.]
MLLQKYKENALRKVYDKCGLIKAADDAGAELNYDTSIVTVSCREGHIIKKFNAIKPALDADVLISLAKGKTHSFTGITGAVKNLFGIVPGFEKAGYHFKLQTIDRFSKMLLDICEYVKPELDYDKCIRCYCCHEMCPNHSIELRRSALYKIISKTI